MSLSAVTRSLRLGRQALAYAADLSARGYDYRKPVGAALSIAIHLCLVLLLLDWSQKGLSGAGNRGTVWGNADGMSDVILPISLTPVATTESEPIVEEAHADQPLETDPSIETTEVEEPEQKIRESSEAAVTPQPPQDTQSNTEQGSASQATKSGAGVGGATSGTSPDLWAAIEPCWRPKVTGKTLPVSLKLSFGPDGRLSAVPVIERTGDVKPDPQRDLSELSALQALVECGAYPVAAGQTDVRVDFPNF